MKVFEVICEYCGEGKEIITERQFVSGKTFEGVAEHFVQHCEEYEKDLKCVREVLVVVEHVDA